MSWIVTIGYEPKGREIDKKLREIARGNNGKPCGCFRGDSDMEGEAEFEFSSLAAAESAMNEIADLEDEIILVARVREYQKNPC